MLPKKQWQPAMLNTQKDLPQGGRVLYFMFCCTPDLLASDCFIYS